jgi:ATP-dependent helicase/nuclease subunit B
MSARLMEPGIAAALASGRVLIVPSAQRAAALRWNWARVQLAEGRSVWSTPEVMTWDAWLEAQWEKARLAGRVAAGTRRLNRSQQLQLWQRVLGSIEDRFGAASDLALHAAALMRSAALAVQWQLPLSRLAVTDEEKLLVEALAEAREWCRQHDCIALSLCTPAQLAQFMAGPAPLIAGQRQLTALQQALGEQCWPGERLLHEGNCDAQAGVRLVSAGSPDGEIRACARWCEQQLAVDPQRRLLVISAATGASADAQGMLLARELCAGTDQAPEAMLQAGLLAVEGGVALAHQQLVADALCALRLLKEPLAFDDLGRVLDSPYLAWGDASGQLALRRNLSRPGFAQWPVAALDDALARLVDGCPTAEPFAAWLKQARAWPRRASRVEWAQRFSQWLGAARFARRLTLDTRDAQRLQRWNELLDEFAALDSMGDPLPITAAVQELQRLAEAARHAARTGDAAITLTAERGAPLARYDGIWVMGLVEQRWPEPPRPDPYVPLSEQRRCGWDEAGAKQRLQQAQWALEQWRACASELVLSHPQLEGDVHHRPSALPGLVPPHSWVDVGDGRRVSEPLCDSPAERSTGLAPMARGEGQPLRQGQERLKQQQACAFRSQAQIRLGAVAPDLIGDGIHPAVRGILLHGVLNGIWQELGNQRALAAQDEAALGVLFERHWLRQVAQLGAEGRPAYPPRLMERERFRSRRMVLRVLAEEARRPFFRVLCGERPLQLSTVAGVITLRVDRIDEDGEGRRWLIDYKSGAPDVFRLNKGEAQPLQLALYEQALAAAGEPIDGMTLLSLAPVQPGFSGAGPAVGWPGKWQQIPDWEVQRALWRQELENLMRAHAAGEASVTPSGDACRNCHLAALCRRADPDVDAEEASDTEGADD